MTNSENKLKPPLWLYFLNAFNLTPILCWPIVFYVSVFIFDKPENFIKAFLIFIGINSYPFILVGSFVLSIFNYKKERKMLAVLLPVFILALESFGWYYIFKLLFKL